MATLKTGYVIFCLLALTAGGCEMVREEGRRAARSTERDSTDEAPPPPIATTPEAPPPTTALSTSRIPFVPSTAKAKTTEFKKTEPKKDDPPALPALETRTLEGKVRGVDVQRRLISVAVGSKSEVFPVDAKAPIEDVANESHALKGGLAGIRPGATAFLAVYKNKNNKEVVSLIRVKNPAK